MLDNYYNNNTHIQETAHANSHSSILDSDEFVCKQSPSIYKVSHKLAV